MASTKCPICDNPGIPDYHLQNVICPHCGSDLSIYKTINEAAEWDNTKTLDHGFNAKKVFVAALEFICIVAVASLISYNVSRKPLLEQIEKMNTEISSLNESLAQAKSEAHTKPETAVVGNNQFIYEVQKNDSPWIIVRKFFGITSDWESIAQKIAEDNGLWDSENNTWKEIHPGQKLTIHNKN